MSWCISSR